MNQQEMLSLTIQNFQQFITVEMLTDWVISQPPEFLDMLFVEWRKRQFTVYDASVKANFERTGLIDTGRDDYEAILNAAEGTIRERFETAAKALDTMEMEQ